MKNLKLSTRKPDHHGQSNSDHSALFLSENSKYISLVNLQLISQPFYQLKKFLSWKTEYLDIFTVFSENSSTFFTRRILQHFSRWIWNSLLTSDILTFCILKNTEPIRDNLNISSFHQNLKITIYSRWRNNRGHATEHLQHRHWYSSYKSPGNNSI